MTARKQTIYIMPQYYLLTPTVNRLQKYPSTQVLGSQAKIDKMVVAPPMAMYLGGPSGRRDALATSFANCSAGIDPASWL